MSHGSSHGSWGSKFTPADPGAWMSLPPSGGGATGFQGLSGYWMFGMPSDQRRTPPGVIFGGSTTGKGGVGDESIAFQPVVRQDETQQKQHLRFMIFFDEGFSCRKHVYFLSPRRNNMSIGSGSNEGVFRNACVFACSQLKSFFCFHG